MVMHVCMHVCICMRPSTDLGDLSSVVTMPACMCVCMQACVHVHAAEGPREGRPCLVPCRSSRRSLSHAFCLSHSDAFCRGLTRCPLPSVSHSLSHSFLVLARCLALTRCLSDSRCLSPAPPRTVSFSRPSNALPLSLIAPLTNSLSISLIISTHCSLLHCLVLSHTHSLSLSRSLSLSLGVPLLPSIMNPVLFVVCVSFAHVLPPGSPSRSDTHTLSRSLSQHSHRPLTRV